MDIKEYIASGILENYVLGATSAQELQEVECMSHIYPEIGEALIQLQKSIEELALAHSKPVPVTLKGRILSEVSTTIQIAEEAPITNADQVQKTTPVIGLKKWKSISAVAASLFVLLAGYAFVKNQNLSETQGQLAQTRIELDETRTNLQSDIDESNAMAEEKVLIAEHLAQEATTLVVLNGTDLAQNSKVKVFWNQSNEKVVVQVEQLNQLADDKQYQLWAIVEGVPQDMGVFDLSESNLELAFIKKGVSNAAAFAVTIEPAGGSNSPSLDQMVVIGEVS